MTALVIGFHENNNFKSGVLNTITAAKLINGKNEKIDLFITGENEENLKNILEKAQKISEINKIFYVADSSLKNNLAENLTAQILNLQNQNNYSHILFVANSDGKNIAPRVAAKLDVAQISEIIKVHDSNTFDRPIYAGNAIATIESLDKVKVITVRPTNFEAVDFEQSNESKTEIVKIEAIKIPEKAKFLSSEIAKNERPELTSAKIVVSGGRALASSENFEKLIVKLADKLNAAVGASRAAVDSGYANNDLQVGQTGKIVAPDLYIACGISGAIQHLAGIKDSKIIVAINKDLETPICKVADYVLESDLFESVPELINKI